MPAQVAVRSMKQRKVGLLGKTAKHQGKSAEGEAPLAAPPCVCKSGTNVWEEDRERSKQRNRPLRGPVSVKTGSEEHECLPRSFTGAVEKRLEHRNSGKSGIEARRQTGTVRHRSV